LQAQRVVLVAARFVMLVGHGSGDTRLHAAAEWWGRHSSSSA
jgi:hypothetical protein